ncbi:hypothetical protein MBLNU230_g4270t1 [Neophaeotheca triangularis]
MAQPKSILKPTQPPQPGPQQKDLDRQNLSIALAHANKIQAQKDASAQLLNSLTLLIDFPPTKKNSTSAPQQPFQKAKLHLQQFQPSDYDDLIGERVIDGRCGYVLCSAPPRSQRMGDSAEWKLPEAGGGQFCSKACWRKAGWVRGQLSEVPCWERAAGETPRLVFWEEEEGAAKAGQGSGEAEAEVEQRRARGAALATERGEGARSFRAGQVMSEGVVEKAKVVFREPEAGGGGMGSARAIEGFEPKESRDQPGANGKGNMDEDDSDVDDDDLNDALFGGGGGGGFGNVSGSNNLGGGRGVNMSDDEDDEEGEAWQGHFGALSVNR